MQPTTRLRLRAPLGIGAVQTFSGRQLNISPDGAAEMSAQDGEFLVPVWLDQNLGMGDGSKPWSTIAIARQPGERSRVWCTMVKPPRLFVFFLGAEEAISQKNRIGARFCHGKGK